MRSRSFRLWIFAGGALSFAAGLGQLSGCAEGTQAEIHDAAPDIVFHPRPGGGEGGTGGEGGITCTATPCVVDVAVGGSHTCAVIADGTVRCWGDNMSGELGTGGEGGTVSQSSTPLTVSGVSGAHRIAAGGMYASSTYDYGVTCAVTSAGPACWGSNQYEMLGRGLFADGLPHADPEPVVTLTGDALLALGQTHACALLGTSFACWGSNTYQQLGSGLLDGSTEFSSPVPVALPSGKKALEAANGFAHTCAILDDHTVACWGYDGEGECGFTTASPYTVGTPTVVTGVSNAARVSAGGYHTCVILGDGSVQCWGYNYQGLLGTPSDGGYTAGPSTIAMPGGHKAIDIAAAFESTCAALDDGTVACWGYNQYGQSGAPLDASPTQILATPTIVPGVSEAEQVASSAGSYHVCARIHGGTVKCWGSNTYGELGASAEGGSVGTSSSTPVDVAF